MLIIFIRTGLLKHAHSENSMYVWEQNWEKYEQLRWEQRRKYSYRCSKTPGTLMCMWNSFKQYNLRIRVYMYDYRLKHLLGYSDVKVIYIDIAKAFDKLSH